jgi:hypothetical protein
MRLLPLCRKKDPLLKIVRERYGANPVAMPRGDIELLNVLVDAGKGVVKPWGPLGKLVTGRPALEEAVGPSPPAFVADLSGAWSSAVGVKVGLGVLGPVLNAFGVPVPGITAAFNHSGQLSFKFSRVTRRSYSAAIIGDALQGRKLRKHNAATALIAETGSTLIIDCVYESPDFSVRTGRGSGAGAKVDVPAIHKILASANTGVSVERSAQNEVSFQADKPVVFGFTALRLRPDQYRGFRTLQLGPGDVVMRAVTSNRTILYASESDGLDPSLIVSTGADEILFYDGLTDVVGVPDGPLVVNAWPVQISDQPALLVPDEYLAVDTHS